MNKKNGYLFLLIALGIGILIGHFSLLPAEKNETHPDISQDGRLLDLQAKLSYANQRIATLQQASLVTRQPSSSVFSNSSKPDTPSVPAAEIEKIEALEAQLVIKKSKEMNQWLLDGYTKSRGFDPGDAMQKKFDEEPVDVGWAQDEESKLMSIFASKPELAGFALRDTKCKSSLCQISISFTDLEQANKIGEQVSRAVSSADKYTSVIASPNAETKLTTLYISHSDAEFSTQ